MAFHYPIFDKLTAGQTALNVFLRIPHPWSAELVSHLNVDAVTLDLQHGMIGIETMAFMLQALRRDRYPMVRLAATHPSQVMHALDAGARGIICPTVDTRKEAEEFVALCYYPPDGIRSYGPIRANLPARATYLQDYKEEVRTFAQIESKGGLENVEEIASVKNLSGLYLGPFDLSIDLGYRKLADFSDPTFMVHVKRVLAAAKKYNKIAAVHAFGEEDAVMLSKLGFDIVTPADDSGILAQALGEKLGRVSAGLPKGNEGKGY